MDFLKSLAVLWQTNTGVVVPRVAEITAYHMRSVLRLPADAVVISRLKIIKPHHSLQIVDWSDFENGLRLDPPNRHELLQGIQQFTVAHIGSLSEVVCVSDVLVQLLKSQRVGAKYRFDRALPIRNAVLVGLELNKLLKSQL